jgi:hypothetical protein
MYHWVYLRQRFQTQLAMVAKMTLIIVLWSYYKDPSDWHKIRRAQVSSLWTGRNTAYYR